jgi:hypothetical protein
VESSHLDDVVKITKRTHRGGRESEGKEERCNQFIIDCSEFNPIASDTHKAEWSGERRQNLNILSSTAQRETHRAQKCH